MSFYMGDVGEPETGKCWAISVLLLTSAPFLDHETKIIKARQSSSHQHKVGGNFHLTVQPQLSAHSHPEFLIDISLSSWFTEIKTYWYQKVENPLQTGLAKEIFNDFYSWVLGTAECKYSNEFTRTQFLISS